MPENWKIMLPSRRELNFYKNVWRYKESDFDLKSKGFWYRKLRKFDELVSQKYMFFLNISLHCFWFPFWKFFKNFGLILTPFGSSRALKILPPGLPSDPLIQGLRAQLSPRRLQEGFQGHFGWVFEPPKVILEVFGSDHKMIWLNYRSAFGKHSVSIKLRTRLQGILGGASNRGQEGVSKTLW